MTPRTFTCQNVLCRKFAKAVGLDTVSDCGHEVCLGRTLLLTPPPLPARPFWKNERVGDASGETAARLQRQELGRELIEVRRQQEERQNRRVRDVGLVHIAFDERCTISDASIPATVRLLRPVEPERATLVFTIEPGPRTTIGTAPASCASRRSA